jgi:hypothetical protein
MEGNNIKVVVTFYFGLVAAKKMTSTLPSPSLLQQALFSFFCCNMEHDDTNIVAFLFGFNAEGNGSIVIAFYFQFIGV